MTQIDQIEILLSKKKMALTLLGSIVFVVIGLWFVIKPPESSNAFLRNHSLIFFMGLISVLFFGLVAVTVIRKLSDKKPGLIISQQGITDNASGVSAGFIPWADIQDITIMKVMNQQFLMFIVINPQSYLERVRNPLKRKTMEINYKSYGSPISISANSLEASFDSLHSLLLEKMREYKA